MNSRTRLSPEQRTAQLLDIGAELFAASPYEDVHIERVAELAGVSRGLLYHYFPTKRAFFAALMRRSVESVLASTAPDPSLSPVGQLRHGVDAYLAHCAQYPHAVRVLRRGAAAADEEIIKILSEATAAHADRILAVLSPGAEPHPLLVIAVRGWIEFLRTASYEGVEAPAVPRADIRDVCVNALVGVLLNLPADARPEDLDAMLS